MKRILPLLLLSACATPGTSFFDGKQGVRVGTDDTVMVYALDAQCPPGDRNDWKAPPLGFHAPKSYVWLVLPPADFQKQCNPHDYRDAQGRGFEACAEGYKVFATSPLYTHRVSLVEHEECHLKGWTHDTPEQMRMYRGK